MGLGVFRIQFDGRAILVDGFVQLSLAPKGRCRGCCGPGDFRVEFDGRAKLGDGLVQFALFVSGLRRGWCEHRRISGRVRWPCDTRRWPRPACPDSSGRCRGCCGPWRVSGRVRWPCDSSSMASFSFPCSFRTKPRLRWASTNFGSSSMASDTRRWRRPVVPAPSGALPRLLWAPAYFGSSSMALRYSAMASSCFP